MLFREISLNQPFRTNQKINGIKSIFSTKHTKISFLINRTNNLEMHLRVQCDHFYLRPDR